jgi:23S rRNA (uracil1939-C5)-methyltransferase
VPKTKQFILENVTVEKLGAKGKSIAKSPNEERTIILEGDAVPGDLMDVQVFKKRKKYLYARPINHKVYSSHRIDPKCHHFGVCGGCKWQQVDYKLQLKSKQEEVIQTFKKVASLEPKEILPILEAPQLFRYRNKFEFTFSDSRWLTPEEIKSKNEFLERRALGFHVSGMWHKVISVKECLLQDKLSNNIRKKVLEFCLKHDYSFFNLRDRSGFLRTLMMRTTSDGQIMLLFQFFYQDVIRTQKLLDFVKTTFPEINSLLYTINDKGNDSIYDLDITCYYGKKFITENLEGLRIRIDAKSFYQTNIQQTPKLYNAALSLADLKSTDLVYDLYCGTGTISMLAARRVKQVVGIELVEKAIHDARHNAKENGIKNVSFCCGDMKDVFDSEFIQIHGRPEVLIIDPPRDGMHPKVVEQILKLLPEKIVYISCNPATQARDLEPLVKNYSLEVIQPVDMFPHTAHVENIALLGLR